MCTCDHNDDLVFRAKSKALRDLYLGMNRFEKKAYRMQYLHTHGVHLGEGKHYRVRFVIGSNRVCRQAWLAIMHVPIPAHSRCLSKPLGAILLFTVNCLPQGLLLIRITVLYPAIVRTQYSIILSSFRSIGQIPRDEIDFEAKHDAPMAPLEAK